MDIWAFLIITQQLLGGRFGKIFFAWGRGRGSPRRRRGGGGRLFVENPRRGGVARDRSVCGDFGGGGRSFLFFRAEIPTKIKNRVEIYQTKERPKTKRS